MAEIYTLPDLPYGYKDLEPHISEEQLKIHHKKHHRGYVKGANATFAKLEEARQRGTEIDIKSTLKELSFHIGGYILHDIFWHNVSPSGGGEPSGALADKIMQDFGNFENFKNEFTKAATSVEGSGWAVLGFCKKVDKLAVMQIEKHNDNVFPLWKILMCVDVWEHAYYLDYKNERGKFIEAFWNLVNWSYVGERFDKYSA
ncbi:superoxide dismutase [Candidatus Saccharibacteria bacterium]|nr:superoxide dismutase [Candidatus Saccharibacteria bacterium]NIV04124.1 superoxide dismutase [Calditrichia bacterium]NIS38676.1 superoxide dismutase [Candidatus Saccharibacteria bacterium]NIV72523.1 superoxide dismutase [Calditrichia bacterium]NIV99633.1 superoxide dismutase [Candidatus Saccharibacteria bacterium]